MAQEETILETERLILRRFREEDLRDLYEYLSDGEVVRFEPYRPMDMDGVRAELGRRIPSAEMIAVESKSDCKLIGNLYLGKRDCCALELGYVFNRRFWGRRYARESCAELILRAFSEGAHRIYAECDPLNTASWRLLERLGFTREAHFRQNVFFRRDESGRPVWKDTYVHGLLNGQASRRTES